MKRVIDGLWKVAKTLMLIFVLALLFPGTIPLQSCATKQHDAEAMATMYPATEFSKYLEILLLNDSTVIVSNEYGTVRGKVFASLPPLYTKLYTEKIQSIEDIKEFVKTLPQGAYDDKLSFRESLGTIIEASNYPTSDGESVNIQLACMVDFLKQHELESAIFEFAPREFREDYDDSGIANSRAFVEITADSTANIWTAWHGAW